MTTTNDGRRNIIHTQNGRVKLIPNPEYEEAQFEGTCLDKDGNRLPDLTACIMYQRPRPPRFKKLPDGSLKEVPAYIPDHQGQKEPGKETP